MASEPKRTVGESIDYLESADEGLSPIAQMISRHVKATEHLQRIATQLTSAQGTEALYEQILDTALAILRADLGCLQRFCPDGSKYGRLQLLTYRGFAPESAKRWEWVGPETRTTCGESLRSGRRIAVADFWGCNFMVGSEELQGYNAAKVRSGQSTPLVSRSGDLIGMVSTYWYEPHDLSVSETRAIDVLARMAADLIERSLAEDKLRESEARLKNAERIAHVGHWQWDLESNRVSGSEEMYRIFGKPPDFAASFDTFLSDVVPSDRERVGKLIQDSLENKVGHSAEYQIVLSDNERRTISCIWEISLDTQGKPKRIFGTCQNITEERRAQEEAFARQRLESVGTLAGGIAHDFNNLLGAVQAQAELALIELDAGSSCKEELTAIREVALRGSEIVRELMTYAGAERPVVDLVDLSTTIDEMLPLLKASVTKHAVIVADLAQDLPGIRAGASQIRQIVINLVSNASDALGDRDGVIHVITRRLTLTGGSAPNTLPDGDYVELKVSDTGHGISTQTQTKVFDSFFTTKSAGRGLGLAVVQGIVRSLGGAVHLTSEPDKGTSLQVLLPFVEGTAGARGQAASDDGESAVPAGHGTVLVVEDEGYLRQPVLKMLRQNGFEVFDAADGTSAVDYLRAIGGRIDAILLDMTTPGASSREIIAEATKVRPDIRIILTSAYGQEMIEGSLTAPQIRGFIRKPFHFGDLLKTLRSSLSS
jgi:PAS domain S-box-containing protein